MTFINELSAKSKSVTRGPVKMLNSLATITYVTLAQQGVYYQVYRYAAQRDDLFQIK